MKNQILPSIFKNANSIAVELLNQYSTLLKDSNFHDKEKEMLERQFKNALNSMATWVANDLSNQMSQAIADSEIEFHNAQTQK